MFHLTLRAAWHDSRWNGTVCRSPSCNSSCTSLARIRETRDDAREDRLAGRRWEALSSGDLPPCKSESGAFMNPEAWMRRFEHPFASSRLAAATHGHMRPTPVEVPPYSTFAVPYWWMMRSSQRVIEEALPESLPPDEEAPFEQAWVFGRARQEALLKLFFGQLVPWRSLVFFYCKDGHPLGDSFSRLVTGIGRITTEPRGEWFQVEGGRPSYLIWDHLIQHSVRPDGEDGFLLPYHDYIEQTGDPDEDARRQELLREIAVGVDPAHTRTFSYVAEHAPSDIALSMLIRALEVVRKIREHGIARGPWEGREEWLNAQIAATWRERGAFPGLGPALESLGLRLGTALSLELVASGEIAPDANPWPAVDAILRGARKVPRPAYEADVRAVRDTWVNLPAARRALLELLSRFALTHKQMARWFDGAKRDAGATATISDHEILENPYRMSEVDLGDVGDPPITVGTIDRGVLPDTTLAAKHPLPPSTAVGSPADPRRIRACIVGVLRRAAHDGDALLSVVEVLGAVQDLDLAHPCAVPADWPATNGATLAGVVEQIQVPDGRGGTLAALQLAQHRAHEDYLQLVLARRAANPLAPVAADWKALIAQAIAKPGAAPGQTSHHDHALNAQARALERLTSRRLAVLTGKAGTGKTTVMGALMLCEEIRKGGILLLAPTGKARVRLGSATGAEAMTVAQFLYRLGRYDGVRQRVRFTDGEPYRKERTVVIDECSMLTLDDLVAVLKALDLVHVQRLILVGDPNQLPPIGVGRPFADLVSFLETTEGKAKDGSPLGAALVRLTGAVRPLHAANASDALRLASWFTREPPPVDADRVLSDLALGRRFNDLTIACWRTPDELRQRLLEAFREHLGIDGTTGTGFDASLGLEGNGRISFDRPDGAARWQILSPVRMHPHGVHDLNRWVQRQFRAEEVTAARERRRPRLGDEPIVARDKVIQTQNESRRCFQWKDRESGKAYIANGEVGLVAPVAGRLKVLFSGRPDVTFDYSPGQFTEGARPLELAYALTVHKAQGSEFDVVFVVVPKQCRLLSREMLYTALTRSRKHLALLVEGDDASSLFDLSRPERSVTARRNTNLFEGVLRASTDEVPYAEHLLHRADKGHMVRSKSELVIANMLHQLGVRYEYERFCEGTAEPGRLRPDFSFATPDGEVLLWEHLGTAERGSYRGDWEWKRAWYEKNGFMIGQTLFVSEETAGGGPDLAELRKIASQIQGLAAPVGAGAPGVPAARVQSSRQSEQCTILFVAANPAGVALQGLDREAHAIQSELERSGLRDRFAFVTRWAAEPMDLLRWLRDLKPTVVHFSGRGGVDPAVEGSLHGLFFQGLDGRPRLVSTDALERVFAAAGASVRVAILNACYSDVHADALLTQIDCIVGVGGEAHADAARSFAVGFYGGLGGCASVGVAYRQGCAAIRLEGLEAGHHPRLRVRAGVDADRVVLASDHL